MAALAAWSLAFGRVWADPPEELAVELKQTEPAVLVFIERTGPYWSLGPLFTPVEELMAKHGEAGPIFVRYATDPSKTAANALNTYVGFFAKGQWTVEPPFRREPLEPMQVAWAVVPGPSGTTTGHLPAIRAWVEKEGHEVVGPVFEIYPSKARNAKSSDLRIEIQLPIRLRSSGKSPANATDPSSTTLAAAADAESPREPEPVEAVGDLAAAEDFERIAEQLMPSGTGLDPRLHVWLGQVIFRIGAVAKGLGQDGTEAGRRIADLADALLSQYKAVSTGSSADPLAQAVVRVDPSTDPSAAQKRTIMRKLDSLLGRVATKAADSSSALGEITSLLQDIQDLMDGRKQAE